MTFRSIYFPSFSSFPIVFLLSPVSRLKHLRRRVRTLIKVTREQKPHVSKRRNHEINFICLPHLPLHSALPLMRNISRCSEKKRFKIIKNEFICPARFSRLLVNICAKGEIHHSERCSGGMREESAMIS